MRQAERKKSGTLKSRQVDTETDRMTGYRRRQSIAADVAIKCLCTGAAVQVKSWHGRLRNLGDNNSLPYTFKPIHSM